MEHLDSVHLFAGADELDRLAGHRLDRQGCSASRVAVELRQDEPIDIERVVEGLRDRDCLLSGHSVDDQQDFLRLNRLLDAAQLVHQRLVDLQTSRGVDNDDVKSRVCRVTDGRSCDFNRVRFVAKGEDGGLDVFADDLQLLNGRGTVNVGRNEQGIATLLSQQCGELAGMRRLAGALQPAEHEDGWRTTRECQGLRAAQKGGQLFVDDLDNLLGGVQSLQNLFADSPVFNPCREPLWQP